MGGRQECQEGLCFNFVEFSLSGKNQPMVISLYIKMQTQVRFVGKLAQNQNVMEQQMN